MDAPHSLGAELLARLRERTQPLHARLDAQVGPSLLRSPGDYARFLQRSLRAVRGLEPAIEAQLGAEFPAVRAALLERDLAALGADGSDLAASADAPGPARNFARDSVAGHPRSVPAAFGAAYVVEGSSLGGQVLAKRVREAFGESAPTSYLEHRGAGTGPRWRWFLGRLGQFAEAAGEAGVAEASAGAVQTFDLYLKAFE